MRELGYIDGKNLAIEWRFAEDQYERLPTLAAELSQMNLDLIVASGTSSAQKLQEVGSKIPIVMVAVADPVGSGLIKSLAHPGGNITGLSITSSDIAPKWLELALSVAPKLAKVGVLLHPVNPSYAATARNIATAAQSVKIGTLPIEVRTPLEIDNAFAAMKRSGVGAVLLQNDSFFVDQRHRIAELAIKYRLPLIGGRGEFADSGCLMSYGTNVFDVYRRAAIYVDKIFKGAKPSDLPVEQPTTYELVINLKAAKALGIFISQAMLIRADRVIE
jgi:putative ABC transport system substrate-binding protein